MKSNNAASTCFELTRLFPKGTHREFAPTTIQTFRNQLEDWRADAVNDGWHVAPIYPKSEDIETACSLTKGEWVAHILMRPDVLSIDVWKSNGQTAIGFIPRVYSMEKLVEGSKICPYCNEPKEKLHHVGFAGTACATCLPKARKEQEFPGWTD